MVAKKTQSFAKRGMYRHKQPHAFAYLSERTTFWVAVMSLFAFVTGNMLGQHGWHVFWASVLGNVDETSIVCDGFAPPLPGVPDYQKWSLLGGNVREHTYRQLPRDYLLPFPSYKTLQQNATILSVDHLGTYKTGRGEGAHPGVDITAPVGMPVLSVANGIVMRVEYEAGGFGNYIVIKHPNVPDPENPNALTSLYSIYAHLDTTLVTPQEVVRKGAQIGTVGKTGFVTGAHLHFQMETDKLKAHPSWTFSASEAREAGLTMTQAVDAGLMRDRAMQTMVNPLAYVETHANAKSVARAHAPAKTVAAKKTPRQLRDERIAERKAKAARQTVAVQAASTAQQIASSSSSSAPVIAVAMPEPPLQQMVAVAPNASPVASVLIRHDGAFGAERGMEKVSLTLMDANGNIVEQPTFDRTLELRTSYGRAEFQPTSLKASDFRNGKAEVQMLPLGQQTVVITAQPWGSQSTPMRYEK